MRRTHSCVVAVLIVLTTGALVAQPARSPVARLRTLLFQREFDTGVAEGPKLVAQSRDASQVKAWYALLLARNGQDKEAIALAEQMTAKKPQDGWAWFALAGALNYARERPADAIAAAEKAMNLLPGNADAIWLRGQTLANDEKRRGEAIAFVDAQRAHVRNPAELLVTKAYALYGQASRPPRDETKLNLAFATFEAARRADPNNLSAWYLAGSYLNGLRRSDEAYPLLKHALTVSPNAAAVHQAYWTSVTGRREVSADAKRAEIEADVDALLKAQGHRVSVLSAVASISEEMKWTARQRDVEESILKGFPDSVQAEWIYAGRWRALGTTAESARSAEYRKILSEFVARPTHHLTEILGEAYRQLFFVLAADESVTGDELYRVAEGALKYETNNPHITWVYPPTVLADRKVHLADAERIARDGIDVLKKKAESQRSIYKSQGEYEQALGWLTGMGHDALGWVLLAEGRLAEAEKELLASYELYHTNRDNLNHLGQFYLAQKDEAKAEEYFVKGLAVQGRGTNPCETSLRALYEKRHGGLDGVKEYFAKLADADRVRRKDAVLSARLATPDVVPSFNLKTLDGKRVSLESLKGRIVVINFWGIWCGWCVAELPDYQKLFEKYANDPAVAILTIDNDANPDDVPPWMAEKKFTFPVLIDDQYVTRTGITAFPTTWFLDPQGRKVFEKTGWSEKLLEEFSWRIEAMREPKRPS